MLNVTSSPVSKPGADGSIMGLKSLICDNGVNLHSLVVPHHDYFQTQFLLTLNAVGMHVLSVEASVIDESDAQWKSGPTVTMSLKVVEDLTNK
jgi:hypothetical protein